MYFYLESDMKYIRGNTQDVCHSLLNGKVYYFHDIYREIIRILMEKKSLEDTAKLYDKEIFQKVIDFVLENQIGKFYENRNVIIETIKKHSSKMLDQDRLNLFRLNTVMIELNNYCNYNCVFCKNGDVLNAPCICGRNNVKKINSQIELSIEELSKLGIKTVKLIGGEPLIEANLVVKLSKILFDKKIQLIIYTNGSLLNNTLIKTFVKYNVKLILIVASMREECLNLITRFNGAYQNLISKLLLLESSKVSYEISYIINSMNENEDNDLLKLSKIDNCKIIKKFILPPNKYSVFNEKKIKNTKLCDVRVELNNYEMLESYNACFKNSLFIDVEGDMYPCIGIKTDEHKIGNIKSGIYKAFQDKKYQKYWNYSNNTDVNCQTCSSKLMCINCKAFTLLYPNEEKKCEKMI